MVIFSLILLVKHMLCYDICYIFKEEFTVENNVKELLPIGSVVLLKDGRKKVMVFGIKQTDKGSNEEHDYIGVIYPEGNMGEELQFFFEHESIAEVVFRGFEDQERTNFINRLSAFYDQKE